MNVTSLELTISSFLSQQLVSLHVPQALLGPLVTIHSPELMQTPVNVKVNVNVISSTDARGRISVAVPQVVIMALDPTTMLVQTPYSNSAKPIAAPILLHIITGTTLSIQYRMGMDR